MIKTSSVENIAASSIVFALLKYEMLRLRYKSIIKAAYDFETG